MKKTLTVTLVLFAASSHADEWVYQTLKDQDTPLGQAVRKNRRDAENQAIRSTPQVKSARECAKPGNVIDEDVRRCMKGL